MNLLILGSGGREAALEWKLSQSPRVEKVYTCPGNGGSLHCLEADLNKNQDIIDLVYRYDIDLTIVGPEGPLCNGIVDAFEKEGLKIFGPNQKAANLEASKDYSKQFMKHYDIKTAKSKSYTSYEQAVNSLNECNYPLVLKADGLCQGKGVVIANNKIEAKEALVCFFIHQEFGEAANTVIIEEFLEGDEISLICLVSNNEIFPLATARDYKKIGEHDQGLNTGGVGSYSPARAISSKEESQIDKIIDNISLGMKQEQLEFNGVLFIGLMICDEEVYVLEFNTRFGDPETQVIMPRLESDLLELILAVLDQNLRQEMIKISAKKALTTILVSEGYPDSFSINHPITIHDEGLIFQNGTKLKEGILHTCGGRVVSLVELGDDFEVMNQIINKRIESVYFKNKAYRKDIGILK